MEKDHFWHYDVFCWIKVGYRHSIVDKKVKRQCLLYLIQIFVNRADQLEFMTLCNIKEFSLSEKKTIAEMIVEKTSLKLDQLDWMHRMDEMIVKTVKSEIEEFEKDPKNAEKMLKICNIFASNWFLDHGNLLRSIDNKNNRKWGIFKVALISIISD